VQQLQRWVLVLGTESAKHLHHPSIAKLKSSQIFYDYPSKLKWGQHDVYTLGALQAHALAS
jgi:hypothetical protein